MSAFGIAIPTPWTWQYEIDVNGDGNWMDIAEHPQRDDLGFMPSGEFPNQLTLANTKQEERYPNALMRYRIGAELNDLKSDLSSAVIGAWQEIRLMSTTHRCMRTAHL